MKHFIAKQILNISILSSDNAWKIQEEISQLYWRDITFILEEVFNRFSVENETISIDRLEIDLGAISSKDFYKSSLLEHIVLAVENALKEHIYTKQTREEVLSIFKSDFQKWIDFLEVGYFGWASNLPSNDWRENVLATLASEMIAIEELRRLLQASPDAVTRLVWQHDKYFVKTIIEVFTGRNQNLLLEFLKEWDILHTIPPLNNKLGSGLLGESLFWKNALHYILKTKQKVAAQKLIEWFLKHILTANTQKEILKSEASLKYKAPIILNTVKEMMPTFYPHITDESVSTDKTLIKEAKDKSKERAKRKSKKEKQKTTKESNSDTLEKADNKDETVKKRKKKTTDKLNKKERSIDSTSEERAKNTNEKKSVSDANDSKTFEFEEEKSSKSSDSELTALEKASSLEAKESSKASDSKTSELEKTALSEATESSKSSDSELTALEKASSLETKESSKASDTESVEIEKTESSKRSDAKEIAFEKKDSLEAKEASKRSDAKTTKSEEVQSLDATKSSKVDDTEATELEKTASSDIIESLASSDEQSVEPEKTVKEAKEHVGLNEKENKQKRSKPKNKTQEQQEQIVNKAATNLEETEETPDKVVAKNKSDGSSRKNTPNKESIENDENTIKKDRNDRKSIENKSDVRDEYGVSDQGKLKDTETSKSKQDTDFGTTEKSKIKQQQIQEEEQGNTEKSKEKHSKIETDSEISKPKTAKKTRTNKKKKQEKISQKSKDEADISDFAKPESRHSTTAENIAKTTANEEINQKPEEDELHEKYVAFINNLTGQGGEQSTTPHPKEGIYIPNAGVVLLHPFLSRFFKGLELTDEEGFVSEEAREQAIYLLHYLATGETETPEYALVIPKLLCGLPLNTPIAGQVELPEHFLTEGTELLEAAIEHWEAIGQVSPASIQEGFLQREGKLEHLESGPMLKVEKKTIDLLLDRLPWNISLFKLSWMPEALKVDWR